MALYRTHATFNLLIALPLLIWAVIAVLNPTLLYLIIFSATFVYATLYMNPDLDLANKIKLFSFRGLLTLPFRGYSRLFRHRGISHIPLIGTLTRILWLGAILYLILALIGHEQPSRATLLALMKTPTFLFGLAGIAIADLCHLLLDIKLS